MWLDSPPQALAEAKKRDAYVLVDLYADWCGWCKQLEKKVFSSPEFVAKARSFVLLRVDTDHDEDGAMLQALHEASSLPNTLILDPKGCGSARSAATPPPRSSSDYIDQQLEAWNELKAHYSGLLESADAETQLEVAKELHKRQDGERAAALYEAVSKKIDPNTSSYVWIQYMLADTYRIDRRFELANQTIDRTRLAARQGRRFGHPRRAARSPALLHRPGQRRLPRRPLDPRAVPDCPPGERAAPAPAEDPERAPPRLEMYLVRRPP